MEILLTNDDGWGAPGIVKLKELMEQFGHVTVVAPDGPRSGYSNAISMGKNVTLKQIEKDVYVSNGTPSDCVKLGMDVLFGGDPGRIDFMVAGINHGSNAGINIIYSGTMGACFVATEHGIPSIGFSIDDHSMDVDFSEFERYIPELTKHILDQYIPYGICYNINAPVGPISGIRWTRQVKGHWEKEMVPALDEAGNPMHDEEGTPLYSMTGYHVNHEPDAEDTDMWAMEHGMISVQPCTIDTTAYKML